MTKPKSWLEAKLESWWQAIKWNIVATLRSAANLPIERYPEIQRDGKLAELTGADLVTELVNATAKIDAIKSSHIDPKTIDEAIDLAKTSLEECKKQTEYQDNKASRLLTVTSFVSALSAALLASFNDRYPLGTLNPDGNWAHIILILAYILFLLFSLSALCGALVTFHAIKTRFKYETDEIVQKESRAPKSMLFYKGIISTGPEGWANSFVAERVSGNVISINKLKLTYLRNYVIEGYLVAAKTADKLRYLGPAQTLLALAMRFLIAFVIMFAVSVVYVPKTVPKPELQRFLMVPPSQPMPVQLLPQITPPVEPPIPTPTPTPTRAGNGT